MKKFIPLFGVLVSMMFILPVFAEIDGTSPGGGTSGSSPSGSMVSTKLANPLKSDYDTFSKFTAGVTKAAVNVLMPFVVLAFIYSGFLFVKAQGNEKELEAAKTAIWYSVIGAFILFGAWGFAQIIGETVSTITK